MDFRTGHSKEGFPLVTIGVLSYNYSRYIREALDSLLQQSYPNIELIIIDDCSTETETRQIIREWISRNNLYCTYIENETNRGITAVSNMIVRRASGIYINLFATDDIMLPEKIERQVRLLEAAGQGYGMCYANVETIDESGNFLGMFSSETSFPQGDVLAAYALNQMHFATPSALIRAAVFNRIGLYDERVLIEDYNFWIRLFAVFKAAYCPYPSLRYRVKAGSGIWDQWMANNRERYYYDRILSNYQALRYVKSPGVRGHLHRKICQYLKALSRSKSPYSKKIYWFLLAKGYVRIPHGILINSLVKQIFR